jgi:hypothetical protein
VHAHSISRFSAWTLGFGSLLLSACGGLVPGLGGQDAVTASRLRAGQNAYQILPRLTLSVPRPAFLDVKALRPGEAPSLVACSFGVTGSQDAVHQFVQIGELVRRSQPIRPLTLTRDVTWPNDTTVAPAGALPEAALVVAGGFLVPTKTGAISLLPLEGNGPARAITAPRAGWFYHRAMWRDMNADGRLDLVTARGIKRMTGGSEGELLWLEQPSSQAMTSTWREHVLVKGPDVHFRMADLDGDGREEIVATEFFSRRLSVHWQQGDRWASRVLDAGATLGSAFDVQVVDLDGDGRQDLLVTNHESGRNGAVLAYELPTDFKSSSVAPVRHTLFGNIEARKGGMNPAAPGQALAFGRDAATGRPLILVSGDASQKAHLLVPMSKGPGSWGYQEQTIVDEGCTVGQCTASDVDGDGNPEVFVPAWEKDRIDVFSLVPNTLTARRTR